MSGTGVDGNADRYASALVLLGGAVLASGILAFGLFSTGDVPRSIVTALAVFYPAAAYAVRHDDDPTATLPPGVVVAGAGMLATLVLLLLAADAAPGTRLDGALYGLCLALFVFLPPAAYATGYGDPPERPAPKTVAAGGLGVALLLLIATIASTQPGYGAVSSLLVFLSAVVYADRRGFRPRHRYRQLAVVAGLVGGVGLGAAALAGIRPRGFGAAALATILGPALAFALTAHTIGESGVGARR